MERKEITIEYNSFIGGLFVIAKQLDKYCFVMIPISLFISYVLYSWNDGVYYYDDDIRNFCSEYCPMLIAFCIAAYVFLLNLKENTKSLVMKIPSGRKSPVVRIFVANLLWFVIFLFLTLLFSFLSKTFDSSWITVFFEGIVIYDIFLFLDLLTHMYGFHTFVYPDK